MLGKIQKRVLGISAAEASFERRGFHCSNPAAQARLEHIGRTFLRGYHIGLDTPDLNVLGERLLEVELEVRGFGFEGAAMALGLLDFLAPWRTGRFREFLHGPGSPHQYMLYVGLGWAWARLPLSPLRAMTRLDPLLGWLAIDGFGFHEGYFNWSKYETGKLRYPRRLRGYACRVFDQGLGRSLWFVEGADIDRIAVSISAFQPARYADLWSGVGLACAYAGQLDSSGLLELRRLAGPFADNLAQGVAFAAGARHRAGNPATHTDAACQVLCGMSDIDAAAVTNRALLDFPIDQEVPVYETWRRRIQEEFIEQLARAMAAGSGPSASRNRRLQPSRVSALT
jgi:enediyne biosynthesis protein E3